MAAGGGYNIREDYKNSQSGIGGLGENKIRGKKSYCKYACYK